MSPRGPSNSNGDDGSDDLELWRKVADTVTPIKRDRDGQRARQAHRSAISDDKAAGSQGAKKRNPTAENRSPPAPASARDNLSPRPAKPAHSGGLDRRTGQKMTRGNVDIDARLDLHGLTQPDAREELTRFLTRCQQAGHRMVLVITGKGQSRFGNHTLHGRSYFTSPERGGVLRAAVTGWLGEAAFRHLVIGFQPAHPKHGGGGAFYVKLRRQR